MGVSIDNTTRADSNVDNTQNQPQPSKSGGFKSVLGAIGRTAASVLLPGLGNALGRGGSFGLSGAAGLGSDPQQYLEMQQQMEQEQLSFETMSMVLKIRADSSMTAIRNMQMK